MLDEIKDDKLDSLIAMDPETSLIESKEAIARQIVRDLPQPCDDLLWGFFRDNYSLKTLADILGKTVGYVKVTKHRRHYRRESTQQALRFIDAFLIDTAREQSSVYISGDISLDTVRRNPSRSIRSHYKTYSPIYSQD